MKILRKIFIKKFEKIWIFCIYLLLPWIFFGIGKNVIHDPLAVGDAYLGIPVKIFSTTFSTWNPFMQSGTFPFKDIGFQSLYPPSILLMYLFPNPFGYNLLLLVHYSLTGFFTYLFLRKLRLASIASLIGGITFMFCGFLSAHLDHYMIVTTVTYLPILLYFIESFFTSQRYIYLFVSALAFAVSIFADYTAVSMYIGMVCFPYIVFRILTGEEFSYKKYLQKIKLILISSFTIFIGGVIIASAQIFPILESLPLVTREKISYEFFASYSFPFSQLPTLIFPYLFGAYAHKISFVKYFGAPNLPELSGYVGIFTLLTTVLSVIFQKNNQKYFWSVLAVIAFSLVLGDSTPLYKFMYKIPIYNMFRVPARNWLEVSFSLAVLSAFFVDYSVKSYINKDNYFYVLNILVILFLGGLIIILKGWDNLFPQLMQKKEWITSIQITSPSVYIPLIFSFLFVTLLYLLYYFRDCQVYWGVVVILVILDLFFFGYFFQNYRTNYLFFQKKPNNVFLYLDRQEEAQSYRIFPLTFTVSERELQGNLNILYKINSISAYSNVWVKEYGQLTKFYFQGPVGDKYALLSNNSILSILSTKYLITSDDTDKRFLDTMKNTVENNTDKILVDGFDNPEWEFVSPSNIVGHTVILRATQEKTSLIQIPFDIHADTYYTLIFDAKVPERESKPEQPLIVDFLGKHYDNNMQEEIMTPLSFSDKFQEFRITFFSDNEVPDIAYLRIFTHSGTPYKIRNVKLLQLNAPNPVISPLGEENARKDGYPVYRKVYETSDHIAIYKNLDFLPRARFVARVVNVKGFGELYYHLWYDRNFNPETTALVEGIDDVILEPGKVLAEDYSNNEKVSLTVQTGEPSFLVLSDSWYPGWKVFVDGKESKIYKTYGAVRGVLINGEGRHTVEFRFIPMSFYLGLVVSFVSALSLFMGTYYLDSRNPKKTSSIR